MIPKKIHYCWFGGNPLPKLAKKCMKSWKKYCPDYEIICWDESNFDISFCPLYVRQAYESKKWAFVTDYVRLKVIYDHGGIYLDTDVELLKNLDFILDNQAYFGFEDGKSIATGLGFGAVKNHTILQEMMEDYNDIPFVLEDGTYDITPCPQRNTTVFLRHGLKQNNSFQKLDNCVILPSQWLCPISYSTLEKIVTNDTVSIHHFAASWHSKKENNEHKKRIAKEKSMVRKANLKHFILHIPNRLLCMLIGENNYRKLKERMKRD